MADQTLAYLRRCLNWHEGRSDDFRSPIVRGMSRSQSHPRQRVLTDAELRAVWQASALVEDAWGRFVRFLLLTACRRGEAAGMRWSEISAGGDWTLPARRNKTGVDLVRPLSRAAWDQLGGPPGEGFVFSTDGGARPLSGFNKLKRQLDAQIDAQLPQSDLWESWRLHDLRRTARTLMSRARVPNDHAERALGHVIGGVRGVYDRHSWEGEKAAAFEDLATIVGEIVGER